VLRHRQDRPTIRTWHSPTIDGRDDATHFERHAIFDALPVPVGNDQANRVDAVEVDWMIGRELVAVGVVRKAGIPGGQIAVDRAVAAAGPFL